MLNFVSGREIKSPGFKEETQPFSDPELLVWARLFWFIVYLDNIWLQKWIFGAEILLLLHPMHIIKPDYIVIMQQWKI